MRQVRIFLVFIMVIAMITTVSGLPEILDGFNMKYDTFKTKLDSCDTCHIPDKKVKIKKCNDETCQVLGEPESTMDLNPYGMAVKNNLNEDMDKAFSDIENLDSDGDKFTNIDEIHNLTFPGDKKDSPKKQSNSMPNLTFMGWNLWDILKNIV